MAREFQVSGASDGLEMSVDITDKGVLAWIGWQADDPLPPVVVTDQGDHVRAEWPGGVVRIGRHVLKHLAWHLECQEQEEQRGQGGPTAPAVAVYREWCEPCQDVHPLGEHLLADEEQSPRPTVAGMDALATA